MPPDQGGEGILVLGINIALQELLIGLWKEQEATVFLVTHSVEEAVYLGDRVFLMAAKPGRLVEKEHLLKTVWPDTLATLMIGLVPVTVFRSPADIESASWRSVQDEPRRIEASSVARCAASEVAVP